MEKLKCKVVMLSTEKAIKNGIIYDPRKNSVLLCYEPNYPYSILKPQHLYFISDREIKEGDIFLHEYEDGKKLIHFCADFSPTNMIRIKESNTYLNSVGSYKIEATTNPSLELPLIPQLFVEKYVAEQGNIKEVMIEMTNTHIPDGWNHEIPKTRKDNTVIVHRVKGSWTREEVAELIKKAVSDTVMACQLTSIRSFTCDEWIEQNL